jgi:multidrug efflux pump subunit AcrA (membrane-fusion protein)
MIVIGIGILSLFLILLVVGVVPRMLNHRELAVAAQKAQNTPPQVYVIKPQPASEADLSWAATTQAIEDTIIFARTSGYISKRYVDIGDQVAAGQLLAEIESPEINQQLRQAQADLQQSIKNLDLQKANLDLARVTMARFQAADKERAVAKEAVDQSVSGYRTAQAAVAAAEANVTSNKANVRRLMDLKSFQRVVAPFEGRVIQRNVDVGATSIRFACSSTSRRLTLRTSLWICRSRWPSEDSSCNR